MMGGNADDPGYHMLTVTDIMVYFDNCKKVGLNMNMGYKKKSFLVQRGRIVHAFFKVAASILLLLCAYAQFYAESE